MWDSNKNLDGFSLVLVLFCLNLYDPYQLVLNSAVCIFVQIF